MHFIKHIKTTSAEHFFFLTIDCAFKNHAVFYVPFKKLNRDKNEEIPQLREIESNKKKEKRMKEFHFVSLKKIKAKLYDLCL